MTMVKNNKKGSCPFRNLKACSEKCAFYRKGLRYAETTGDPTPFEECAINIIADNLEAMHNRTYMLQKEVGETKGIIALKTMVDLDIARPDQAQELRNHIQRVVTPPEPKKSLE
jgi:hypothetical protein